MPRAQDPGEEPKQHMPYWKYGLLLGLGALFDILKAACVSLIFLLPLVTGAIAGAVANKYASTAGCWEGGIAAAPLALLAGPGAIQAACDAASSYAAKNPKVIAAGTATAVAALTGAAEVALAPVTGAVEGFGVILAIFVGLVGWLLVIMILLLSGAFKPFENGAKHFFVIFGAFAASITPLVDVFPTFTPALWKVCHDLRKVDAKHRREWEAKKKDFEAARAQDRQDRIGEAYKRLRARDAEEEEGAAAGEASRAEAAEGAASSGAAGSAAPAFEGAARVAPLNLPKTLVPTPSYMPELAGGAAAEGAGAFGAAGAAGELAELAPLALAV